MLQETDRKESEAYDKYFQLLVQINEAINNRHGVRIALGDAVELLDKVKDRADALVKEGQIYQAKLKYEKIVEYVSKYKEADTSIKTFILTICLSLLNVYDESYDYPSALRICNNIFNMDPDNRSAALKKISVYIKIGNLPSAEQELQLLEKSAKTKLTEAQQMQI